MNDSETPGRRVLCAVANLQTAAVVQRALSTHAHLVCVSSAFETLRATNASAFDAFVLDVWLTDWSGVQLCRQIKAGDPHVPVIMVTAPGTNGDARRRAVKAGANAVIETSEVEAELSATLDEHLHAAARSTAHATFVATEAARAEIDRQFAWMSAQQTDSKTSAALNERIVRTKARKAFMGAGGTSAAFERTWKRIYAAGCGAPRESSTLPRPSRAPDVIQPDTR